MYVQAGAFGDRANAEQLRKRLVKELAKLQVQVRSIDGKASSLYKVQIGPLDSRAKASDVSSSSPHWVCPSPMSWSSSPAAPGSQAPAPRRGSCRGGALPWIVPRESRFFYFYSLLRAPER